MSAFFRLFFWFILRHFRHHRGRAMAVILGIALGAAVFSGVRLSVQAALQSFGKSMDQIAGKADFTVVRPGERVSDRLAARLIKLPAVRAASPVLSAYVRAENSDNPFLLLGLDPISDRLFRLWTSNREGSAASDRQWLRLLTTPWSLIAAQPLARELGIKPGDALVLEHAHQNQRFTLLDQLSPRGLARVQGGRIAITDIATFQELTGAYGQADRIDIRLAPAGGENPAKAIQAALPAGTLLRPPSENKQTGTRMIRAYALNLSLLSFVSLFVGSFLVYSLVALNSAARRRELAILRAVGASSQTVFMLFIGEGLFLGAVGWLIALPMGAVLVKYLLYGVSQTISELFVRVEVDQLHLSAWEIALSLGLTLGVCVLAAWQPAHQATRVSPKTALAPVSFKPRHPGTLHRPAVAALLCLLSVFPLSQLPPVAGVPVFAYLASLLLFVGCSLLAPFGIRSMGRLLSPVLTRAGQPAFLAARYLRGTGVQSAVSVGALITAVALFVALVIMIHSFRGTVQTWVDQTVSGDLFIQPQMAWINQHKTPLGDSTVSMLKRLAMEADFVPYRRFHLKYGHTPYLLEAVDMEGFFRHGDFSWIRGDIPWVRQELIQGNGVLVSQVFAHRTGLGVGARFQDTVAGQTVELPVLGVVRDYRTHGGVVFTDTRLWDGAWSGVRIFFRSKAAKSDSHLRQWEQRIRAQSEQRIDIRQGAALRQEILTIFDQTFAVTTVLLIIALAVAALGIATTLTVRVLERVWELNTLSAIGADIAQIRAMILWEALLMVIPGELAGLLGGMILAYLLIFVINLQSFGWTFILDIPWHTLGWALPLIMGTALVAALPAVRMAFQTPPAAILRENR